MCPCLTHNGPLSRTAHPQRARSARAWAASLPVAGALMLAGCGSSTLSSGQLHHRAARICALAQQRSESIPTPSDPGNAARFLRDGIAALGPQVRALHKLKPPSDLADDYDSALRASDRELSVLHSTLHSLDAGADPVMATRTLQRRLDPVEDAAAGAWRRVGVPACARVLG
jgi:hypothetical protein